MRIFFSNTANQLSLSAGVVASDTILLFSGTATGWPSSPCKAVIDPDTDLAEVVLITAIGPSSFTVTRGQDGTSAQNHVAGAIVEHRWSAAEADEANLHANLNGGVHGITGDVVGTDDVQTLSNKHLVSPTVDTATFQASPTSPAQASKASTTGSANIAEYQDPSGVTLTRVGQHGEVEVDVTDASKSPLVLKMAAGQTADGLQLRKSDNSIPFKVDKDGDLTSASLTTAGAASAGSVTTPGAVSAGSAAVTGAITAASLTTTGDVVAGGNISADNVVTKVAYASSNAAGTPTAGEFKDGGVGDVTFTAVAGHKYRIVYHGRCESASGTNSIDLRLRDGGASSPTTSSTQLQGVSIGTVANTGADFREGICEVTVSGLSAGTHKVAAFIALTSGSGTVRVGVAGGGLRELTVYDEGTV